MLDRVIRNHHIKKTVLDENEKSIFIDLDESIRIESIDIFKYKYTVYVCVQSSRFQGVVHTKN